LVFLVIVGCMMVSRPAEATPDSCQRDQRTLWFKDLYRGDELRLAPFGRHGIPCRRDWLELSRFFRDRQGHRRSVAPGLLRLLAQFQRHFGRRQLHVMSGYRSPNDPQALSSYHQEGRAGSSTPPSTPQACSAGACPAAQARLRGLRDASSGSPAGSPEATLTSYHQVGHAADIWIDGVENRALFEYCRALQRAGERLGCGLYPRGQHVHVDVRSRATIWVDLSGYGDGAAYVSDPDAWLQAHPAR
jgi:uncharacterized protein YcbK (DUF882 family)